VQDKRLAIDIAVRGRFIEIKGGNIFGRKFFYQF
jgi:hypothetical protein